MKKERMEKFGFSSKNYVNMHFVNGSHVLLCLAKGQIFGSHEPSIDLQQNTLTGKVRAIELAEACTDSIKSMNRQVLT